MQAFKYTLVLLFTAFLLSGCITNTPKHEPVADTDNLTVGQAKMVVTASNTIGTGEYLWSFTIHIQNLLTKQIYTTTSGEDGLFYFYNLPEGLYTFRTFTWENEQAKFEIDAFARVPVLYIKSTRVNNLGNYRWVVNTIGNEHFPSILLKQEETKDVFTKHFSKSAWLQKDWHAPKAIYP